MQYNKGCLITVRATNKVRLWPVAFSFSIPSVIAAGLGAFAVVDLLSQKYRSTQRVVSYKLLN